MANLSAIKPGVYCSKGTMQEGSGPRGEPGPRTPGSAVYIVEKGEDGLTISYANVRDGVAEAEALTTAKLGDTRIKDSFVALNSIKGCMFNGANDCKTHNAIFVKEIRDDGKFTVEWTMSESKKDPNIAQGKAVAKGGKFLVSHKGTAEFIDSVAQCPDQVE